MTRRCWPRDQEVLAQRPGRAGPETMRCWPSDQEVTGLETRRCWPRDQEVTGASWHEVLAQKKLKGDATTPCYMVLAKPAKEGDEEEDEEVELEG